MNGHLVQGPRVHEVNRVRFPALLVTDVDSRDGDVVELVTVRVRRRCALMGRPKALDLAIKGKAVDDGPDTEGRPEQDGRRVSDQVSLGEPARRSWLFGRCPSDPTS